MPDCNMGTIVLDPDDLRVSSISFEDLIREPPDDTLYSTFNPEILKTFECGIRGQWDSEPFKPYITVTIHPEVYKQLAVLVKILERWDRTRAHRAKYPQKGRKHAKRDD